MYFLIIYGMMTLLGFYVALKLSSYVGLNKTVALSVPFRLVFLLMLNALKTYDIPLTLIAFFGAIGAPLFWLPFHKRFSQFSDHGKRGAELGMMYTLNGFFAIIAPLAGGLIVSRWGFNSLYIIASLILVLSLLPLFFIKEEKISTDVKVSKILKGRTHYELLAYFAEGYRINAYTLWAIYMFLFLASYVAVGGISSVVIFFNTVSHLFIGYVSDVWDKKMLLRVGAFVDSLTWFVRVFFTSMLSIFAVTSLSSIAISVWRTPFAIKYYDKLNMEDGVLQLLFREVGLVLGKSLLFLFAMVFGMKFALVSVGFVLFFTWIYR
jgi:MFS family permease